MICRRWVNTLSVGRKKRKERENTEDIENVALLEQRASPPTMISRMKLILTCTRASDREVFDARRSRVDTQG